MTNTTNNSKTNNTEIGNNINRSSQLNANNDQDNNLKSHSIYRRFLPGLLMLLLGVAFATTGAVSEASAQNTVADWLSYMPANGGQQLDNNGDGTVDFINYDTNGDGLVEAARGDSNLDGYLEAVMLDTDRNGVFNEVIYDNNLDGVLETAVVDSNQDGTFDMVGYDLNGTGSYSGWTYLAQQGLGVSIAGYDLNGWTNLAQQGTGGLTVSIVPDPIDVTPDTTLAGPFLDDILAILEMGIDVPRGTEGLFDQPKLGDIISRLGNAQSNLGGLTPPGWNQVLDPLTGDTKLQHNSDLTPQPYDPNRRP